MASELVNYKILIVGDCGVGKSSLVEQFVHKSFRDKHVGTLGIPIFAKNINIEGKEVKLNIFDSSGHEAFRLMRPSYYRNALGILLVYDITRMKSFEDIINWYVIADKHVYASAVFLLVGNKSDLQMKREVSTEKGQTFAKSLGFLFMETSAKFQINTEEVFQKIANEINSPSPDSIHGLAKERLAKKNNPDGRLIPRHRRKKKCCGGSCLYSWLFR